MLLPSVYQFQIASYPRSSLNGFPFIQSDLWCWTPRIPLGHQHIPLFQMQPKGLYSWELTYCWWFRNPANQLRLVVYPIYPIIYRVFLHPRWCGISSINTIPSRIAILKMIFSFSKGGICYIVPWRVLTIGIRLQLQNTVCFKVAFCCSNRLRLVPSPIITYICCIWNMFFLYFPYPRCSMYGIFAYICHNFKPNVGKYTIHGAFTIKVSLKLFETCVWRSGSLWIIYQTIQMWKCYRSCRVTSVMESGITKNYYCWWFRNPASTSWAW